MPLIFWAGAKMQDDIREKVRDGILSIAQEMQGDIQESMRSTPRGGGGGSPQESGTRTPQQRGAMFAAMKARQSEPSSPGHPPAIQTGNLVRSVMIDDSDIEQLRARVGVFSNAPYAGFLEGGTESMEARPFLKPAMDRMQEVAGAILDDVKITETGAPRSS